MRRGFRISMVGWMRMEGEVAELSEVLVFHCGGSTPRQSDIERLHHVSNNKANKWSNLHFP